MAYPSKTDRETILAAAVEQLEAEGLRGMSLRALAAKLGIAPNALYRYFADRSRLEAAISAESSRQLHGALRAATGRSGPEQAIRRMAAAYLVFARERKRLYEVLMMPCSQEGEDAAAHEELWRFVVEQVALIAGRRTAAEAAVALWAFLHGMASLESAEIFSEEKPLSSFEFGLKAWFRAAAGLDGSRNGR
jgi:AcrR family transcriptional regulator